MFESPRISMGFLGVMNQSWILRWGRAMWRLGLYNLVVVTGSDLAGGEEGG